MSFLSEVLTSAGVSALLLVALAFLLRNWLAERIGGSIRHEYDRKIEQLRDELAQHQSIRSAATAALTATHVAGYDRTLQALETIWAETVRLREKLPLRAGHADLLLPEEYEEAFSDNENYRQLVENVDEYAEMMELYGERTDVEVARAFAGEFMFSLFYAYRAFSGRVASLILRDFKTDGVVRSWHDDKALKDLLVAVLSREEQAHVNSTNIMRLRTVQQMIERKMLSHIASVVSGESSANVNLQQAYRIVEAANTLSQRRGG